MTEPVDNEPVAPPTEDDLLYSWLAGLDESIYNEAHSIKRTTPASERRDAIRAKWISQFDFLGRVSMRPLDPGSAYEVVLVACKRCRAVVPTVSATEHMHWHDSMSRRQHG